MVLKKACSNSGPERVEACSPSIIIALEMGHSQPTHRLETEKHTKVCATYFCVDCNAKACQTSTGLFWKARMNRLEALGLAIREARLERNISQE